MEPQRHSIQDIIPPARSRPIRVPPLPNATVPVPPTPPPPPPEKPLMEPPPFNPNRRNALYSFLFIGAIVLVLAGVVVGVLSTVFHRVYVTITPYRFEAFVNSSFEAGSGGNAVIPYE